MAELQQLNQLIGQIQDNQTERYMVVYLRYLTVYLKQIILTKFQINRSSITFQRTFQMDLED
jgi:hypothetical protein